MIKSYRPYITILLIALVALVVLSIAIHLFLSEARHPETIKRLSVYAKIASSVLVLVLGFSVIPVIVKFSIDSMPASIQENAMSIVYIFWFVFLVGLVVAVPAMWKAGFFQPESPEAAEDSPKRSALSGAALPPLEYQINHCKTILLATTRTKDNKIVYRIDQAWKCSVEDRFCNPGSMISLNTHTWELLGYAPVEDRQVVLLFEGQGTNGTAPLEILPVEGGKISYGCGHAGDAAVCKTLSLEELKSLIEWGAK